MENGADYWLACYGKLSDYYISKEGLYALGWKNGKPPKKFAPERMCCGGIYNNDGHLPSAPERIWHEADINYYEGRRNQHRILFSNYGLIFVTYDHYQTFYEIYTRGFEMDERISVRLAFTGCKYIGKVFREMRTKME